MLRIDGITKIFGGLTALEDVSLFVNKGSITGTRRHQVMFIWKRKTFLFMRRKCWRGLVLCVPSKMLNFSDR